VVAVVVPGRQSKAIGKVGPAGLEAVPVPLARFRVVVESLHRADKGLVAETRQQTYLKSQVVVVVVHLDKVLAALSPLLVEAATVSVAQLAAR
jgi:hypothetical protein